MDWKLPRKALLIADPRERKTVCDSSQSQALRGNLLLPVHISASDNEPKAMQRWVSELVVVENGFERTAFSPVV
jgi:hypothetical protein